MEQELKIKVLREDIIKLNLKETYGLYKIKNIILETKDLELLEQPLKLLEAGFNLKNYILTTGQQKLFKAYEIDITTGKDLNEDNIKNYKKELNRKEV